MGGRSSGWTSPKSLPLAARGFHSAVRGFQSASEDAPYRILRCAAVESPPRVRSIKLVTFGSSATVEGRAQGCAGRDIGILGLEQKIAAHDSASDDGCGHRPEHRAPEDRAALFLRFRRRLDDDLLVRECALRHCGAAHFER